MELLWQGGLRGSQEGLGGMGPGDEQVRYLQDSCNNVKRSGYHMQQAIVRTFLNSVLFILKALQDPKTCADKTVACISN